MIQYTGHQEDFLLKKVGYCILCCSLSAKLFLMIVFKSYHLITSKALFIPIYMYVCIGENIYLYICLCYLLR